MNAKGIRILAAVIGLALVLGAVISSRSGDVPGPDRPTTRSTPSPGGGGNGPKPIEIELVYSPEKEKLLTRAFAEFNDRHEQVGDRRIVVTGTNISSGKAFDQLRAGTLKPTIWSPSSSMWGRLLTQVADVPWVPKDSESFARTPLVIAMWEAQARALGWPKKELGWSDVIAEAGNPKGFARYGHPEWGRFRLGQTNPDFSTSGLSAVVAEYYAATGKTEGLTAKDLNNPAVRAKVRSIQSSIVHYGDTTLFFAEQLAKRGPAYASAVAMEETTLVDYNTREDLRGDGPKLVGIYPKEGTFFSDNPLIVLEGDWVSKSEQAAADKLVTYLLSKKMQQRVGKAGFRPADPALKLDDTLSAKNGVDPDQPKRRMSLPSPQLIARIRGLWHEDRKPADVAIVLDVSGSMLEENRLVEAQGGLIKFVDFFGRRDRAALISFSDVAQTIIPLGVMNDPARARMKATVDGLFAEGGTAVYDATLQAVKLLREQGDPQHIQAVVVLTDGLDNKSSASLQQLLDDVGVEEAGAQEPVRVFTIAYGSDASIDEMREIANSTGALAYEGNPDDISAIYTSISSFF